jgi:hypothetical protein
MLPLCNRNKADCQPCSEGAKFCDLAIWEKKVRISQMLELRRTKPQQIHDRSAYATFESLVRQTRNLNNGNKGIVC